jgi:hypothetical protein
VETDLSQEGIPEEIAFNTLRARLEFHRENPACQSCHQIMDPIGLALENFDLVGRWRDSENGHALDTQTELMDGTPVSGPNSLRNALLDRREVLVSNFIEKLSTYALGREIHSTDMAAIRSILASSAASDYRFSDIVLGIVGSEPFLKKMAEEDEGEQLTVAHQ